MSLHHQDSHTTVAAKTSLDADSPSSNLDTLSAPALMEWAADRFGDSLVMSTSFGIQAAVTLQLAKRVLPNIRVIWIDTGYLPPETYRYVDQLVSHLDLNLQVYQSTISPSRMEALHGRLWETGDAADFQRYDDLRKVEPLQRAFRELKPKAWVSGLRSQQTDHRKTLARVSNDGSQHKLLPILHWTNRDVHAFMQHNGLPQHPLFERGYSTVGDWHSSRALAAGETDERATRFGGLKQECGIHLPRTA